jgi:hypothetical protein
MELKNSLLNYFSEIRKGENLIYFSLSLSVRSNNTGGPATALAQLLSPFPFLSS